MAEEKAADTEADEVEAPKSKKKLIIIAGVVALVLIIATVVTVLLMGGDEDKEEGEANEPKKEAKQPALYLELSPPILTTFNVKGKQRYMQVALTAMAREQAVIDAMQYHMPFIRSRINALFSSQDFEFVQTEEGKLALQSGAVSTINDVLKQEAEGSIENVYFTNFVMQ